MPWVFPTRSEVHLADTLLRQEQAENIQEHPKRLCLAELCNQARVLLLQHLGGTLQVSNSGPRTSAPPSSDYRQRQASGGSSVAPTDATRQPAFA